MAEVIQTEPVRQAVLDERNKGKAESSMGSGVTGVFLGNHSQSAVVSLEYATGLLCPTAVQSCAIRKESVAISTNPVK